MTNMKRYVFIIGLWAACLALPNTLQAQWGFTVTQGQRGNCSGCGDIKITVINFGSIPVSGFPTKQECEAARQYLAGISQSFVCGCTLYVRCSGCTGKDIAGFGFGADGSVNTNDGSVRVSGTSQGSSYYTPNSFDALQDAYDQKNLQNEKLFGEVAQNENAAQYLLTADKDFNGYIAKILPKGTLAKGRGIGDGIDWDNARPVFFEKPDLSEPNLDGNKDRELTEDEIIYQDFITYLEFKDYLKNKSSDYNRKLLVDAVSYGVELGIGIGTLLLDATVIGIPVATGINLVAVSVGSAVRNQWGTGNDILETTVNNTGLAVVTNGEVADVVFSGAKVGKAVPFLGIGITGVQTGASIGKLFKNWR
jgi:hypothetical protein